MINFCKNNKQLVSFCLILIISSLVVFSLGVKEVSAAEETPGMFMSAIQGVIGGILLITQEIIGGLVAWFAGLAQGILGYTDTQNAQMVKDGWKIVRDLVNMFFVLILLTIAFATILRFEPYGMKALLPKLIIAALLINFSLVLAGTIIDFSGVLTNFFIQDSTSFFNNIAGSMGLAKIQLTNAEQPSEYWQCSNASRIKVQYPRKEACQKECTGGNLPDGIGTCNGPFPTPELDWTKIPGDKFWKVAASLFLSIIFTAIAAFVFGAFAFLLLVRVIIIWFLLILAPLAWFFSILPATLHLFEQWWKAFIKWVFFAPAAIFFIWLSVSSWVKFISGAAPSVGGEMISGMKEVITDEITQAKIMPQVMLPENFIQFILACGMLIGSLIVAQKMSITFADSAVKLAKNAGGKISGVNATKKWWKARGAVGEDEAKERRKRKMALGRVGQFRQTLRENIRPTVKGRAEARARKNAAIALESKRMSKNMDINSIQRIAGQRTGSLTAAGRMQKLAAQILLTNPKDSKIYKQMESRISAPKTISEYQKITKLANRVDQIIKEKKEKGEYTRYNQQVPEDDK